MSIFSINKGSRVKRSKFNLSHEKKLSCNMGNLIPTFVQEIIPGDKFQVSSEMFIRLSPLIAPMMHRVNAYMHFFFVPNRLVWTNWESFITGGANGDETPAFPQIPLQTSTSAYFKNGSLGDYMGLPEVPSTVNQNHNINALPFRAYQEIYNEYYLDQNLQTPVVFDKGDGINGSISDIERTVTMRQRAWEKDYLTSCLPWSQRSPNEAVVPLNGQFSPTYQNPSMAYQSDGSVGTTGDLQLQNLGQVQDALGNPVEIRNLLDPQPISGESGITINDLRRSARLQEWLEKQARGGARYIETILSHFSIKSSDARLQRPEYLGGGKTPVVISEVLSTATSDSALQSSTSYTGQMAGHGISVGNTNRFRKGFEEHGYVLGLMSILPKTAYQQNINRHWNRTDKFDFYWPEFANLGEQSVANKEAYADFATAESGQQDLTFGYQSRYAEYKYQESTVHGDFRDTLDFWHMGRQFTAAPSLNESFIQSDPTERVFTITDPQEHKLYCQVYNNVSALRPMPYFGTPRL